MGLAIKNNIMASNAARHLGKSFGQLANSVERLSSGLRINSAKDDAAGLAVRELMRADIAVLEQGARNANDGISMLQTMEGAMSVMDENLIRMKELAEQSATGSYSDEQRTIMNAEFSEMADEIERIANATQFNGIAMLNTNSTSTNDVKVHVGTTETVDIERANMTKSGLGIETGTGNWSLRTTSGAAVEDTSDTTFMQTGTNDVTFSIQFTDADGDDENEISFSLAAGNHSMQDVADAFNVVSQNFDNDAEGTSLAYESAEIIENTNGDHQLVFNARTSNADGVDMHVTAGDDGIDGVASNAFGSTSGTNIEETTDYWEELNADGDTYISASEGGAGSGLNILTTDAALEALDTVGDAITTKDAARAAFGYKMNRLESTQTVLNIQAENLKTSESRISDVDVATEMATMTRNQVLSQAGVAMLSQANTMPQMALSLLR